MYLGESNWIIECPCVCRPYSCMFAHETGLPCFCLVCTYLTARGAPLAFPGRHHQLAKEAATHFCSFLCRGTIVSLVRHSYLEVESAGVFRVLFKRSGMMTSWWVRRVSRFFWERSLREPQDTKDTSRQAVPIVQRPGVYMATFAVARSPQRSLAVGSGAWMGSLVVLFNLLGDLCLADSFMSLGSSFLIRQMEEVVSASRSTLQCRVNWTHGTGWDYVIFPLALTKTG